MSAVIRIKTRVLPGSRIEIIDPDLVVGEDVEVTVQGAAKPTPPPDQMSIYDWLMSLPRGPRSTATWEEIEADLQAGRDSWDR